MHLGINIQKAQNTGIHQYKNVYNTTTNPTLTYELQLEKTGEPHSGTNIECIPTDIFVHAFCKLFGHLGIPEWAGDFIYRLYNTRVT